MEGAQAVSPQEELICLCKEGVFIPLQCAGSVPVVIRQSPENICNLADFLSLQDKMQDRSCFLSLEAPCRANDCGGGGVQPDGF